MKNCFENEIKYIVLRNIFITIVHGIWTKVSIREKIENSFDSIDRAKLMIIKHGSPKV